MRYDAPPEARTADDTLGQIGRVGSMSLIVFSIITFIGSIVLPWVINSPDDEGPGFTPRPPQSVAGALIEIEKHKPSLLTAWTWTLVMFSAAMILAPFVHSLASATTIVAFCGV
jgi:solute carrier family 45, member 1/2/4